MTDKLRQNTATAATLCSAVHVVSGLLRAFALAPGLSAPDRMTGEQAQYISLNGGLWAVGWLAEAAAVASLAVLLVLLVLLWARDTPVRALLALVALSAGLATSLTGHAIAITVIPRTTEASFPIAEGTVVLFSSGVGAGLLGVAMALVVSTGVRFLPWRMFVGSMAVFVPSTLLVVSTLVSAPRAMGVASVLQILGTIGWMALLGRELSGSWPLAGLLPARPGARTRRR